MERMTESGDVPRVSRSIDTWQRGLLIVQFLEGLPDDGMGVFGSDDGCEHAALSARHELHDPSCGSLQLQGIAVIPGRKCQANDRVIR